MTFLFTLAHDGGDHAWTIFYSDTLSFEVLDPSRTRDAPATALRFGEKSKQLTSRVLFGAAGDSAIVDEFTARLRAHVTADDDFDAAFDASKRATVELWEHDDALKDRLYDRGGRRWQRGSFRERPLAFILCGFRDDGAAAVGNSPPQWSRGHPADQPWRPVVARGATVGNTASPYGVDGDLAYEYLAAGVHMTTLADGYNVAASCHAAILDRFPDRISLDASFVTLERGRLDDIRIATYTIADVTDLGEHRSFYELLGGNDPGTNAPNTTRASVR